MATYNNIKKIKIGDNIFNLYDSGNSGGTITSVKTTAGAHTAVNVTSGAVSFNVPTKTSHLTNDSGFLTSHQTITKAMVTTALGTGSGTTKFLREDGSWATPAYIANTDAKLQVAEVTSATQYYPLVGTGTTAATRQYDTTGFKYKGTTGTTSAVGSATVELGNSTASGTAGNKQAQLIMYGSNAKKATITLAAPSADIALALPTSGGTLALTSQIPTVSYPVTSVNSKTGAVSLTASDVGALASNTTYVSKITTSAGTHSAISNKSGAVSFNVPTTAAHVGIKFGYTTSGNNRAVQQDSSGNLYVTQKDDDTTYSIMSASELSTGTATTARTMSAANTKAGLLDLFYPVGSYYETSDSTFDPNTTWGGTWVLEESGRVHVSAGTGYTIGATGGNKDAIIPYHNHSVNAVATTGGDVHSKTLDETSSSDFYYGSQTADSAGIIRTTIASKRMYSQNGTATNAWAKLRIVATHDHGFTNPTTPAHNTNYAGSSGNTTNANMQPYIVVNRWHRTA